MGGGGGVDDKGWVREAAAEDEGGFEGREERREVDGDDVVVVLGPKRSKVLVDDVVMGDEVLGLGTVEAGEPDEEDEGGAEVVVDAVATSRGSGEEDGDMEVTGVKIFDDVVVVGESASWVAGVVEEFTPYVGANKHNKSTASIFRLITTDNIMLLCLLFHVGSERGTSGEMKGSRSVPAHSFRNHVFSLQG